MQINRDSEVSASEELKQPLISKSIENVTSKSLVGKPLDGQNGQKDKDEESESDEEEENEQKSKVQVDQVLGEKVNAQPAEKRQRLLSLDAYRGLTIVGMIMVDRLGEETPTWLVHPDWDGITVADFVFPSFLFIMGMAVPLAVSKKKPLKLRNVVRVFLLFLVGFVLNLFSQKFDFTEVRVYGILQRMSICYGAVLFIHWVTEYGQKSKRRLGVIAIGVMILLYLSLMLSFEDSSIGCTPQNNLQPICNLAGYIDRAIFTTDHLFQNLPTDPEGIFSNLNAIATTYMGYYFTLVLLKNKDRYKKTLFFWFSSAILCGLIVYPLTKVMSFNKHIYSTSYLFLVNAVIAVSISVFLMVIDLLPKKYPNSQRYINAAIAPLLWLGLNPLALFITNEILPSLMDDYIKVGDRSLYQAFYEEAFKSWMGNATLSSLAYAFFFVLLYTVQLYILYRNKLFLRL